MPEQSPTKIAIVETPLGGTASLSRTPPGEPAADDSTSSPQTCALQHVWCQPRRLMRYHYEKVDYIAKPATNISSQDVFLLLVASLAQLVIFLPLRNEPVTYTICERTLLLFWPLVTFARIHIMLHTLWPSPNDGINLLYKILISLFILLFSLTVPAAFLRTRVITAWSAFFIILVPSALLFRNSWYEPLLQDVANRANQLALIAMAHIMVSTPYFAIMFVSSTFGVNTLYWSGFAASVFMHFAPHAAFFWLHRGRKRSQTHIPPRLFCNYEGFRMLSRGCFVGACVLLLIHGVDLANSLLMRVSHTYGVAALSLISLISLHTIHDIDTAPSNHLNPRMIASVSSTFLFAVLHFFVLLFSAACAQLMTVASDATSELTASTRKLFSVSWACALLVTTILSAFRTRLENRSRIIRLCARLVITVVLSSTMAHSKVSATVLLLIFTLCLLTMTMGDFILERYESHNISPFVNNGEQFTSFRLYESSLSAMQCDANADVSTVLTLLESRNGDGVYPHLESFKQRLLMNDDTRLVPIESHPNRVRPSTEQESTAEEESRPVAVVVLG